MSKKKKIKSGVYFCINKPHTQRFILRDGETASFTNEAGEDLLVTTFKAVHGE